MKLIYRAGDLFEAHIICGLLKSNGIEAHVTGHYLQGGVGELSAMGFANVHVADEDFNSAKPIIIEYENEKHPPTDTTNTNLPILIPLFAILTWFFISAIFYNLIS